MSSTSYSSTYFYDPTGVRTARDVVSTGVTARKDYSVQYPSYSVESTFGTIFAPRLIAGDLNVLEIGSSGKVAVTLEDSHSLDIRKASGFVLLESRGDLGAKMQIESGAAYFEAASNGSAAVSGTTASVTASGAYTATAASITETAGTGDVVVTATAGDVKLDAFGDLNLKGQTLTTAFDSLALTAANTLTARAGQVLQVESLSNDVRVDAKSNVSLTAQHSIVARASNLIDFAASNSLSLASLDLSATARSNVTIAASNDVSVIAGNKLDSAAALITLTAGSNIMTMGASNAFALSNAQGLNLHSGSGFTLGSGTIAMASTGAASLSGQSIGLGTTAGAFALTTVGGGIVLDSGADLSVAANAATLSTSNLAVTCSNAGSFTAAGSITLDSGQQLIALGATSIGLSNAGTGGIGAWTGGQFSVASGSVSIGATGAIDLSSATGDLTLTAPNNKTQVFKLGSDDIIKIALNTNANRSTDYLVTVNADFDILGLVNTVNSTVTNLYVADKVVLVASASNDATLLSDGASTNSGAGLQVFGLPSNVAADSNCLYEKSIKWNYGGSGVSGMGGAWDAASGALEPFWEVLGGGLRVTKRYDSTVTTANLFNRSQGDQVTYGFRVNDYEELELFKGVKTASTGLWSWTRVSKFGREMNA